MKYFRSNDFNPDLFHPYYIIRRGLYRSILNNAAYMKGRMLDFGCGSKPYRSIFSVDEYIGLDYENEGHSHEFEEIDMIYDGHQVPFPDAHFDAVLSTEVFEHVFNLPQVLGELNRVMKPGAHLLITCPFVWNEHEVPYDYARYTRFALQDMMERSGFEIVHYEKSGNFVLAVFQLWILYWFQTFYGKCRRILPLRYLFSLFFLFIPNCLAVFCNFILPARDSLYLNNVMVVRKKPV